MGRYLFYYSRKVIGIISGLCNEFLWKVIKENDVQSDQRKEVKSKIPDIAKIKSNIIGIELDMDRVE